MENLAQDLIIKVAKLHRNLNSQKGNIGMTQIRDPWEFLGGEVETNIYLNIHDYNF